MRDRLRTFGGVGEKKKSPLGKRKIKSRNVFGQRKKKNLIISHERCTYKQKEGFKKNSKCVVKKDSTLNPKMGFARLMPALGQKVFKNPITC